MWIAALVNVIALAAEPASVDLTVMSFNIRFGTANDGENAWPKRDETVINMLNQYDADIIGLQECLRFQAEYIVDKMPQYRWVGIGRNEDGGGEYTAVAYRHERLVPVEVGQFWLSETPDIPGSRSWDAAITRMVTWVKFYLPEEKQFFYHYNTHFDHRGSLARSASAVVIGDHIKGIPSETPVIVTGDFNAAAENSEPYERAIASGLTDSWVVTKEKIGPEYSFGGFKAIEPDRVGRIDWVLFRGDITVASCETSDYNEDGRFPSDHLPIVAKMTINFTADSE